LTNNISVLKHNYSLVKPLLETLVSMKLLIKIKDGVLSGKNKTIIYLKVLPDYIHAQELFTKERLKPIQLTWPVYAASCCQIVLCSDAAKLSSEVERYIANSIYLKNFVLTRSICSKSVQRSESRKMCKPKIKRLSDTQPHNTILRYFPMLSSSSSSSSSSLTSSLTSSLSSSSSSSLSASLSSS
ncbi:unnamed protein product, partial [Rotaria magnacalcarata]